MTTLPELLELGVREPASAVYFERLIACAPVALHPTLLRDRDNTLVAGELRVPTALSSEAIEVAALGRCLETLGDLDALLAMLHAARLYSTASALAHAMLAQRPSEERLAALVEVVLDAAAPQSLSPQWFERFAESSELASLAEYVSYRHAILEPSLREGSRWSPR